MSGDNGKLEEKTQEQLKQERIDRFTKDPDSFTENTDLIVAMRRSPSGMMTLINNATRIELELSWARLSHGIHNAITSIEMQEYIKKNTIVTPPKGAIPSFARSRR